MNNQIGDIWRAAKAQGLIPDGNEFSISAPKAGTTGGDTMTTQEQRAEWRALAQAATPGEWRVEQHSGILHDGTPSTCAVLTSDEYDMASFGDDEQAMCDAAFIAAARTAVPQLLADVDALTQDRDALAAELERVRAQLAEVPEPMLYRASTRPLWTDDTPTPGTR